MHKDKNILFYLKIIFCVSLLLVWIILISNTPKIYNKTEIKKEKIEVTKANKKEQPKKDISIKPKSYSIRKEELPKLANLKLTKETDKKLISDNKTTKHDYIPIQINQLLAPKDLSNLVKNHFRTQESKRQTQIALRNKAHVDKSNLKPIFKKIVTRTHETNEQISSKVKMVDLKMENTNKYLDQIASQLELIALLPNSNGVAAAIIKNKINNKIEILKKGENLLGLELQDLTNNQIVLGNENLNKKYIKKIQGSE